jgi:succinate dehydrogenase / fumarate reductase cytochrome b subunit
MNSSQRPLSPHLQVYRPQWTSVLSILHRITGVVLSVGTLGVVWALVALAQGEAAWQPFAAALGSVPGTTVAAAFLLALFYHLLNGIRHLLWDAGRGLDLPTAFASGWAVVIGAIGLTAVVLGVLL